MAASYLNSWAPDVSIAAHTAVLAAIDAGSAAAKVTIHDSSDTLLATITLTDPAGTVHGTTGQLSLAQDVGETSATAGTASYATLRDSDDNALHSLPCQAGSSPVSGYCVISTTAIATGGAVDLVSWTIG